MATSSARQKRFEKPRTGIVWTDDDARWIPFAALQTEGAAAAAAAKVLPWNCWNVKGTTVELG